MRKTNPSADYAAPDLTSTDAYGDLYALCYQAGDAPSEPQILARALAYRDAAEKLMVRQAQFMRANRYTWDEIGSALGMTRQGAQRMLQRAQAKS